MPKATGFNLLLVMANGRQLLTLSGGGGSDTYTLTFLAAAGGETTAAISETASAGAVQAALEALASIAPGDVAVAGSAGGPYTVEWTGKYAGQAPPLLSPTPSGTLAVAVAHTTPGADVALGGQTGIEFNRSTEAADARDKDGNGWPDELATGRAWSASAATMMIEGEAGVQALEDAYNNLAQVFALVETPAGNRYRGRARLDSFAWSGPTDDMFTGSVELSGAGPLEKV